MRLRGACAALAITVATPTLVSCAGPSYPRVPPELVGGWDGGSAGESDFQLSISADGTYALFHQSDMALRDEGHLEVTRDVLTMHSADPDNDVHAYLGVQECSWAITKWTDYGITMQTLWLCGDDFSYLR